MSAKISVITPIYKTEAFLDKSLPSLTAQTLPDVELIWIDNIKEPKLTNFAQR